MSDVLESKNKKISTSKKITSKVKIDEISNEKVTKNKVSENETGNVKISSSTVSENKANTSKISTNKAARNKVSTNKTSTNKTKQESKINLDEKNKNDKFKKNDEKSKNESKSTIKNEQSKINNNQKNRTTKKENVSTENTKKDIDEKILENQKLKNGITKKENVKNEKIKEIQKDNLLKKQSSKNNNNEKDKNNEKHINNQKNKEQDEKIEMNNVTVSESKFDTVSLKQIREALGNKVNDNQKQKVVKKVLINIGFAIIMIIYLIIVALATKNIEMPVLEKDLKIITLGILALGIVVLERAYKKDNGQMAINAVEILIFGAVNLCMMYAIKINFIKLGEFEDIINNIAYMSGGVAIYYMLKSIIISVKNVRKFKKENNDIKEIIKK